MPVLIGLAHGSRHSEIVPALARLMHAVEAEAQRGVPAGHPTPSAFAAFLDLTEPDLPSACRQLAAAGVHSAVVVPLLFTQAFHATQDTPNAVAEAIAASGLGLVTAAILGTGPDVRDIVIEHLAAARVPVEQAVLLFAVGSSDPAANAAIAALAQECARTRGGGPVAAAFGTVDPRATSVLPDLPGDPVIVPLFVSPGLLLDALARAVAPRGLRILDPLGTRLAPVVLARYTAALADSSQSAQPDLHRPTAAGARAPARTVS